MRKIILIVAAIALIYLTINQLVVNSYDGPVFSDSKQQSKAAGLFVCDFVPGKDSIQLSNKKIKSPDLWSERGHRVESFLVFFKRDVEVANSYNLVLENDRACASNEYMFDIISSHQTLNCLDGLGYVYYLHELNDTILIRIKQGDPAVGWKKEVLVDSLIYKKI